MTLFRGVSSLLATLLLSAAVAPMLAQNAQIGGRVVDPSGAVIPGTAIIIMNTDTGVPRRTSSNDEGYYAAPMLQPGRYRLTAQKEGFRPLTRDGIVLQVGDRITLNLPMEVGAASDSVTISAEVPLLRTEMRNRGW